MKSLVSFAWILALLTGLIYTASIGNPAAQAILALWAILLLVVSAAWSIMTIEKWLSNYNQPHRKTTEKYDAIYE